MAALFITVSLFAVNQPAYGQQLATDDVVLKKIWTEAVDNSQFVSLSQALLDSLGPGSQGLRAWSVPKGGQ